MARGQRKTLEEKITAKEELIEALLTRVESEKRELEAMYKEKRVAELETIGNMIEEWDLTPEEAVDALRTYAESRAECAS